MGAKLFRPHPMCWIRLLFHFLTANMIVFNGYGDDKTVKMKIYLFYRISCYFDIPALKEKIGWWNCITSPIPGTHFTNSD